MSSPAPGPSSSRAGSTEWLAAVKPSLRPSTYSSTRPPSPAGSRRGSVRSSCWRSSPGRPAALHRPGHRGWPKWSWPEPPLVRLAHQALQQHSPSGAGVVTANNPLASGIDPARMEPKEMKTLSAEDAKASLDATADDRSGPLCCLRSRPGSRRGESPRTALQRRPPRRRPAGGAPDRGGGKRTPVISGRRRRRAGERLPVGEDDRGPQAQWARQKAYPELLGSVWRIGLVFMMTTGEPLHPRTCCGTFISPWKRNCPRSGSTTFATPWPRCCSTRRSTPRWSRNCSATPTWPSR